MPAPYDEINVTGEVAVPNGNGVDFKYGGSPLINTAGQMTIYRTVFLQAHA